jgi:hypothetical protein
MLSVLVFSFIFAATYGVSGLIKCITDSQVAGATKKHLLCCFWSGLKLQGQIGKFGNVELSDISAFLEMPDGKVRS